MEFSTEYKIKDGDTIKRCNSTNYPKCILITDVQAGIKVFSPLHIAFNIAFNIVKPLSNHRKITSPLLKQPAWKKVNLGAKKIDFQFILFLYIFAISHLSRCLCK